MILNGFGFAQQRLYLTPKFFERVPTERLIGEGVHPKHLSKGAEGRALDDLFEYGVTELVYDFVDLLTGREADHSASKSWRAVFARLFDPRMSDPGRPNETKSNLLYKARCLLGRLKSVIGGF